MAGIPGHGNTAAPGGAMDFLSLEYWAQLLRQGYGTAYYHFGTPFFVLLVGVGLYFCWRVLNLRH